MMEKRDVCSSPMDSECPSVRSSQSFLHGRTIPWLVNLWPLCSHISKADTPVSAPSGQGSALYTMLGGLIRRMAQAPFSACGLKKSRSFLGSQPQGEGGFLSLLIRMLSNFVLASLVPGYQLFPAAAADPREVGQPHSTPVTRTGSSDFHASSQQASKYHQSKVQQCLKQIAHVVGHYRPHAQNLLDHWFSPRGDFSPLGNSH